jgi:hypothetical protein
MGFGKGGSVAQAQAPSLTGLLGGQVQGAYQGAQQQGNQQALGNALRPVIGAAEFAATLTYVNDTVARVQADLTAMQAAMRDMGGHQSMLLGYIAYLNPENGERPTDPMNYTEWSKLQQVSDVINLARKQA